MRKAGQRLRQIQCCGQRLPLRHKAVGQPHGPRLFGIHRAPRQDQVIGAALSDHARKAEGAPVDQWHAPAAAINAHHRALGHDAHVAPGGKFHAPGHGGAFDRGNHGLGQHQPRWPHRAGHGLTHRIGPVIGDIHRLDPVGSRSIGRGLEIETCAKGAVRPGQDHHVCTVIDLQRQKRIVKRLRRGWIDRIACLWPIDRDHRYAILLFHPDCHGLSFPVISLRGNDSIAKGGVMQHLEEKLAHLIRTVDDLSDVVAAQQTEIDRLTRRVEMLMHREAERESAAGDSVILADQRPPHW